MFKFNYSITKKLDELILNGLKIGLIKTTVYKTRAASISGGLHILILT